MYEERSVTRRTALPLVVVAATFFLPMAQSCDHAVSPLQYLIEDRDALAAVWIVPTFVTALVLAGAVFRSWRAKAKNALAFAAMGAFALTLPVFAVLFGVNQVAPMAALYFVASVGTTGLLLRARRKRGWERLSALLDTYAVAAFPLATTIAWLARYSGAYLFVIAYVAFATQRALVAIESVRSRQRARKTTAADDRVRVGADEPRARIGQDEPLLLDTLEEEAAQREGAR